MEEKSIPWIAFTSPMGHYEWLVMSFDLKNELSIFQRKMDALFYELYKFTIIYIDDVLVFSKTKLEHVGHLKKVLSLFMAHGIVISKSKMELFRINVKFLGVKVGDGHIKLQPHISTKILAFPNRIDDIKSLRQFLGLLNYARAFIPNLARLAGPFYAKKS